MTVLKITIPSQTENIRIVESFIDNARDRYSLSDDIYGNIMVAVTEAVNNAIIHGNKCDKDKNVLLSLQVDNNTLHFVVRDEGSGFDPDKLPDPTAPENLLNPGGRGIFLMKHLSDRFIVAAGGKEMRLTFAAQTLSSLS
ncbi:MAG: ATP-binding protein [Cytophagales bacterium]|nr:MAG: ATP-binding protein [Cytophagales bacterium]TAF59513.1 MAG: ATP-binding protein [Cytophagales bacterium]